MFENTEIEDIEGTPLTATTAEGHRIHCEHVLIATHVPLQGRTALLPATLLQSKLAPYTSYAVGGWAPRGTLPEALFWDNGDPYNYLRVDRRHDHDFVIFGGEDHKTGQVEKTARLFRAARSARQAARARAQHHASLVGPGQSRPTTACLTSARRRSASSSRPAFPATA